MFYKSLFPLCRFNMDVYSLKPSTNLLFILEHDSNCSPISYSLPADWHGPVTKNSATMEWTFLLAITFSSTTGRFTMIRKTGLNQRCLTLKGRLNCCCVQYVFCLLILLCLFRISPYTSVLHSLVQTCASPVAPFWAARCSPPISAASITNLPPVTFGGDSRFTSVQIGDTILSHFV